MASKGYVETLLNALPDNVKGPVTNAFRHVLDNLSIGVPDPMKRSVNFRWTRFDAVTSSVANTEFSIHHGLGQVPLLCLPVAWLDSSGGQMVTLKITRPADAQRVYLSSPSTGASVSLLVEV
jgi:hypothetical protein